MKLILNFNRPLTDEPIPYDHQYMAYSGILNALSGVNSSLSDRLHSGNGGPEFVMSQLLGGGAVRTFDRDGINAQRYVLLIASRRLDILSEIKRGVEKAGEMKLGTLILPYHSGEIIPIHPPGPTPELVTRSPVALKVNGRFLRYGDEGFVEALKESIVRKYGAITGNRSAAVGFIRILEAKRKLILVGPAKIPATFMRFVIDAESEVVRTMLTDGVGSKTQLGFGFVEVVR